MKVRRKHSSCRRTIPANDIDGDTRGNIPHARVTQAHTTQVFIRNETNSPDLPIKQIMV